MALGAVAWGGVAWEAAATALEQEAAARDAVHALGEAAWGASGEGPR
jgi:hypothetical protein